MKDRIMKILEQEGLSPARFANQIGTQPSIISHILNGRNKPSLEVVQKVLNTFPSINPDWLIFGSGSMYREELPSRQASLFDIKPDIAYKSTLSEPQKEVYKAASPEIKQEEPVHVDAKPSILPKTVKKITVYYSDMTFEEFLPGSI
jgi:transcriptional regulator with XRE-family HTH domain